MKPHTKELLNRQLPTFPIRMSPDSQPTPNPLDEPFGESFADWLARRCPIGAQPPHAPAAPDGQPAAFPTATPLAPQYRHGIRPGDYTQQLTARGYAHTVHLIEKHHARPWHPIPHILAALGLDAPLGWRDFHPLSPHTATLIIHTD